MKRELTAIKNDVSDLKGMVRKVVIAVAKLTGEVSEIKRDMVTRAQFDDGVSGLNTRIDGLAATVEDSRFRWAVHADTLLEHDRRLKKLEARKT